MESTLLEKEIDSLAVKLLIDDESHSFTSELQTLAAILTQYAEHSQESVSKDASRLLERLVGLDGKPDELSSMLDSLRLFQAGLTGAGQEDQSKAPASNTGSSSLADDLELLGDFVLEATGHVTAAETCLLSLEQDPENQETTNACFRAIHTIKGVAGFLELHRIGEVAHEAETVLDQLRNGLRKVSPAVIDVLLKANDFLREEIAGMSGQLQGGKAMPASGKEIVLAALQRLNAPAEERAQEQVASSLPSSPELSVPEAPVASPATALNVKTEAKSVARSVKVDTEKLDYLADMVGELVVTQSMLNVQSAGSGQQDSNFTRQLAQLGRITAEVQKTAMGMRMVPLGQTFQRLTRLVRDVSRQLGKNVNVELSGEDIELDRNIVEELADPLMHMVRNSLDHGIEIPEQRKKLQKPEAGCIRLAAKHRAGQVQIEISDDGRGLDPARILAKGQERGLVSPSASLSEAEILQLIFEPGFSTAEKVTDISGRGVGMDVVRKQIQKLRGRVDLQSTLGKGTTFVLRLPLTLAIIDALVVGLDGGRYIVPLSAVKEVLRPSEDMIHTVEGRHEMVMIRGRLFPLFRLATLLQLEGLIKSVSEGILITIEAQSGTYCLAVDELLGKSEVVIKSLGDLMPRATGISGGAVLGDGRIGLIIDPDFISDRHAA